MHCISGHARWRIQRDFPQLYIHPRRRREIGFPPIERPSTCCTTGDGTATINIDATIAGESVLKSNQFPKGKYSFSLLENDNVTSRVQNLAITVSDSNSNSVFSASNIPSTLFPCDNVNVFCSSVPFSSGNTFSYTNNAGTNGASTLLLNGDAYTIMTTHSVPGGGFGSADMLKAVMQQTPVTLVPGSYTVTFTGTVKDNTGTTSTSFGITQTIHIIGQGCGIQ